MANKRAERERAEAMLKQQALAEQQFGILEQQYGLQKAEHEMNMKTREEELRNRVEYVEPPPNLAFTERTGKAHYSLTGSLQVPSTTANGVNGSQTNAPPMGRKTGLFLTPDQHLDMLDKQRAQSNYQREVEAQRMQQGFSNDMAMRQELREKAVSAAQIKAADAALTASQLQVDEYNKRQRLATETEARSQALRSGFVSGGVSSLPFKSSIVNGRYDPNIEAENTKQYHTLMSGMRKVYEGVDINNDGTISQNEKWTEADLKTPEVRALIQAKLNMMGLSSLQKLNSESQAKKGEQHPYFNRYTREQIASSIEALNQLSGTDAVNSTGPQAWQQMVGYAAKLNEPAPTVEEGN